MANHPDFSKRSMGSAAGIALLLCLFLFALLRPLCANAQFDSARMQKTGGALTILRITPAGDDVPAGRQIIFEFNRPVVPLGRMERKAEEIPVSVDPALDCQWRWLNPSALACQLTEKAALVPATRYRVTIRPGIMTEDKVTISEAITHTFTTERPKLTSASLKTWVSPGKPQMRIRFNLAVQEGSVADHVYFQGRTGLRIPAEITEDPEHKNSSGYRKGFVWLATPRDEFPLNEPVELRVEPGIVSNRGPEAGVEDRVVLVQHTFPEFRFLGVECQTNGGKKVRITSDKSPSTQPRCNPSADIALLFSAPVLFEDFKEGVSITPDLASGRKDYDPWQDYSSYSRLSESRKKDTSYPVELPWNTVKPYSEYQIQLKPGVLKDEFGRVLTMPVDMRFATDHKLPDLSLLKEMPVLEKGLDTDAAILVTNLQQVGVNYEALTTKGKTPPRTKNLKIPKVQDATRAIPLGIRELIQGASGVVHGRLTPTPPVPEKHPSEKWFFAQVTPFSVHAKIGHHNTLVWVTDLKSGEPVSDVKVQILQDAFKNFAEKPKILSNGKTRHDGVAELGGTAAFDPTLDLIDRYEPEPGKPSLFVRCEKGDDIALMPLRYDFRVASEGANQEYISEWLRPLHGHIRTWGATAQGIYKVGDTVQFKIYVRDQDNRRFVAAPKGDYNLKVMAPTGKVVHELKGIGMSDFGAFHGEFTIPKTGAVGWYRFVLTASYTKEEWEPIRVLVSDFTPSPFKVTTDLNGTLFRIGDTVKVTTQAKLHAGGPFVKARTRITALLESKPFAPRHPKSYGFSFDVLGSSDHEVPTTQTLSDTQGVLDDKGALDTEFNVNETPVLYGNLVVESAVRDDRGKSVANRASATYAGRDRYVGLLQRDWLLRENKPAKVQVVVVDQDGKPAPGTEIAITVERRETKGSRVKGAGSAYITQYTHEWVEEAKSPQLISGTEPQEYAFTPVRSGSYRITAVIKDTSGREHRTGIRRWVAGGSPVLWESIPGNLLNVNAERQEYRVGETARFMVENPFPGAKALITVERFGVIQNWVKTFATNTEVVEFPVLPDYLPGFYLSVMVMSPRVEKPVSAEDGSDGEDLGKPTFRMGYAHIEVKDPHKEIAVQVKPDKEVFKPRDTVTVNLHAAPRNMTAGEAKPPIELAVAVLDESVFDLLHKGKASFDPYEGFYHLDPLDLSNYNLVMQLVGRQKLEKKGANAGGGGGPDLVMRSVFKYVSYWNPSVFVDGEGKAKIEFQVPDNLTGWRVLVMAVTPEDRMGLGDAVFRVNQTTEIRPVLPNQVTEGDNFQAGFSIMNRTDRTRTVEASIQAEGPVQGEKGEKQPNITQQVTLDPYKRTVIRLPLQTTGQGRIVLTARAGDAEDRDAVRHTLAVLPRQSLETAASYGTTTSDEVSESVVFPEGLRPDVGQLSVTLSPTAIGGVEGAFRYLRDYPYTCWEQILTKGVAASFFEKLKPYLDKTFSWEGSGQLAAKTLSLAVEHQAPNGGMVYYIPKDEYADPYLSAFTALSFNWLRENGHNPPQQTEEKLDQYLQNLLRHDAVPDFYNKGMTWTVRAVALAALADRAKVSAADVERFWARVPEMSLFGKALYLQAMTRVKANPQRQQELLKSILAHANQSGGTLTFSESLDAGYRFLLSSTIRENCTILSALLAYEAANPSGAPLGDIPVRLMRTITEGRKGRSHWLTTQENLFALKALTDFARIYEKKRPNMTGRAWLNEEKLGETTFKEATDPPAVFDRPLKSADAGSKATLKLRRSGEGRLYYSATLSYAPSRLETDPVNAGIEIQREYTVERGGEWVLLQSPMEIKTGELVRVDLYVSLPAERHFVVVKDPVPGGLEPVNRELATASVVDAKKTELPHPGDSIWHRFSDWLNYGYSRWSFYHRELRHDSAVFYSEFLPAGRYHLVYGAQAVAPGEFTLLPSHAEEMYNPDVFGKTSPAVLHVQAGE